MNTQIVTPKGQFSYPNVFRPKRNPFNKDDKTEYYTIDILFDKTTDLSSVKEAIQSAISKKFGSDKSKYSKKMKLPIKDGDETEKPEYAGKFYIQCKCDASKSKPQVFDRTRKILESESDISGGDFGHVLINFYCYERNGNCGVGAGLNGVMVMERTDKPFSGRKSAFEAFDSLVDDSYQDVEQNEKMFE